MMTWNGMIQNIGSGNGLPGAGRGGPTPGGPVPEVGGGPQGATTTQGGPAMVGEGVIIQAGKV